VAANPDWYWPEKPILGPGYRITVKTHTPNFPRNPERDARELRRSIPVFKTLNVGRRGKPEVHKAVLEELARAQCLKAKLKAQLKELTHAAIAKRHGIAKRTVNKIYSAAIAKGVIQR